MYYIEAKEKLNRARTKRRIVCEGVERLPASVRVAPCFFGAAVLYVNCASALAHIA